MGRSLAILLALVAGSWLSAQSTVDPLSLSVKPGIYRQDQLLVISTVPGYSVRYRFGTAQATGNFLPVSSALSLSAMDGETRDYRLSVQLLRDEKEQERRELLYTIDKTIPVSPEPDLSPGTWYKAITIVFTLPADNTEDRIRYSWTASDGSSQAVGDGPVLQLGGHAGEIISYRVQVWAEDPANQTGVARTWVWHVDRRRERDLTEIPVFSPVEGRFQNPQFLYIDKLPFAQLRYSTDGSDPRNGPPYTSGTIIQQTGRVQLRVWGKTLLGKEMERTIVYEAGSERLVELESGSWGQSHIVQFASETYYYTAGERQPTTADETLANPLRITPQAGALRGVALRLLRARDQANFRFYLVLDGRQPQIPEVWARTMNPLTRTLETMKTGQAVQDSLRLDIKYSDDSQVWYTSSGKKPDTDSAGRRMAGSSIVLGRDELSLASNASGICTLHFQAQQADGQWGPSTSFDVWCGPKGPAPRVEIVQAADGSLQFSPDPPGESYWYLVDSDFHQPHHRGPFHLPEIGRMELPYGATGNFSYTFFRLGHANQISLPQSPILIQSSNVAPADPVIRVISGRQVEISGNGAIRYRILSEQNNAPSSTKLTQSYTKPFLLEELPGANIAYTIEAWSEDTGGRSSAIVRSEGIFFHAVAPRIPEIANEGTEIFRNTNSFRLSLSHPEAGMRYFYQYGPAGSVADPGSGGTWVDREIPIQGGNADGVIELRVRAVSSVRPDLASGVSRFLISIMTKIPQAPTIIGVSEGQISNQALEIRLDSQLPGLLSYRLVQGELQPDSPWTEYRQPIAIPAPANSDIGWRLQTRFQDKAGNLSEPGAVRSFRILTRNPALPDIQVKDVFGATIQTDPTNLLISRNNLVIAYQGKFDRKLRLVLATNRTQLKLPDSSAMLWETPIPLEIEAGQEKTWYLQYRAIDEAGNMSQPSPVYTLMIDRAPPPVPEKPQIVRQGNGGTLSWTILENATIEYLLSNSSLVNGTPNFAAYNGERATWSLPDGSDRLYLYYRSRDRAQNFSEIQNVVIERSHQAPFPRVIGVQDGGLYRDTVSIDLLDAGVETTARYELTVGDQARVEASNLSSLWGTRLEVGPIAGETVRYHLSIRQYVDGLDPSDPLNLDFTIDRTPPRAPEIAGLAAVTYSSKDQTINFESESGAEIWYSLQTTEMALTDSQDALTTDQINALRDRLPVQQYASGGLALAGKPGLVMRYVLMAWSLDAAGNRSKASPTWQVFVDIESVYVRDPLSVPITTENGPETGSRTEPFRDFERAWQFAEKNHKTSLRLGLGRFALHRPLTLSSDLVISGGYNPESWTVAGKEASILYPQAGFADDRLLITGHRLTLQRLFMADGGQNLQTLIEVNQGNLEIFNCNLAITQSAKAILVISGSCLVKDSVVSCNDPLSPTLIELQSSRATLQTSTIESTELPPILLKNQARADYRLVSAVDSKLTIIDCELKPRRGRTTTALHLRGGTLDISGKNISTGAGTEGATAFDIGEHSMVRVANCQISGEGQAGNTVLFRSQSGVVTLESCILKLAANAGIYGFMVDESDLRITGCEIQAGKAIDFMTVVSAKGSKLDFGDNRIIGTETEDFRIASLQGGESTWHGNTVLIHGGGPAASGSGLFFLNQAGQHEFSNNTLTGDDQHTLFYLGSLDGTLTVRNNIIEHWRFILQEIAENLARQSDTDRGINSLQLLEGTRRQGSLFEGNKVRQGL